MTKDILTLYHYSKAKIPCKIDPKHFGSNGYTRADLQTCRLARAFYYIKDNSIPEYYIKGWEYKYIAYIDKCLLYDLRIDPLKLIDRFKNNIPDLLLYIKSKYKGAIYNLGGYDVVILFYTVKYDKIINRG
jgi:hypothetical protein